MKKVDDLNPDDLNPVVKSTCEMIVISVDLRLIPMAGGFLAALFVSAFRPDHSYYAMIACNLLATVNMFYIWAPQRWEQ